jgi:hypothetical protein
MMGSVLGMFAPSLGRLRQHIAFDSQSASGYHSAMPTNIVQLTACDGPNLYGPHPAVLLRVRSDAVLRPTLVER